jgi:MFS transporter, DHA1 family, 2-module integral membrane pump EmrD
MYDWRITMNTKKYSHSNNKLMIISIIQLLVVVANFSAELYLPSLPAIAKYLSVSDAITGLTFSAYFLGVILGQIFYGVYSDYVGRRKVILFGVGLAVLGVIICIISSHGFELIIGRFIQGLGIASCVCIPRSIIRDIASGKEISRIYSRAVIAMELSTSLAPVIGSYIQYYLGWQANFLLLLVLSLSALFFVSLFLPETAKIIKGNRPRLALIGKKSCELLKNNSFVGNAICSSMAAASIYSYLTITPFLYQESFDISLPAYGLFTGVISVVLVCGALLNMVMVKRLGIMNMLQIGIAITIFSSLLLLVLAIFKSTFVFVLAPFLLFTIGLSFIFPNCLAGAMESLDSQFGLSSAIYSAIQLSGVLVLVLIVSTLPSKVSLPFSIFLFGISLLSLASFRLLISANKVGRVIDIFRQP